MSVVHGSISPAWADNFFHLPRTEAEQKLDTILTRSNHDENLFEFILKRPWYNPSKGNDYQTMFTPALLEYYARLEAQYVKESCGGTYIKGEICGFDYDPVSCTQDPPDGYRYRTVSVHTDYVIIFASAFSANVLRSNASPFDGITSTYRLVKYNGVWKLDGVDCGDNVRFRM